MRSYDVKNFHEYFVKNVNTLTQESKYKTILKANDKLNYKIRKYKQRSRDLGYRNLALRDKIYKLTNNIKCVFVVCISSFCFIFSLSTALIINVKCKS